MRKIRKRNIPAGAQSSTRSAMDNQFHEIFLRVVGNFSSDENSNLLRASCLETPLGSMVAIADEKGLYALNFMDYRHLEREIQRLKEKLEMEIILGENIITHSIQKEMNQYFNGKKMKFETPIHFLGTLFQKNVWKQLMKIPIGETRSYADVAQSLRHSKAYRAVALANASNSLVIIIPCHRVINSNGKLGGYGCGIDRKQWLLEHEKRHAKKHP